MSRNVSIYFYVFNWSDSDGVTQVTSTLSLLPWQNVTEMPDMCGIRNVSYDASPAQPGLGTDQLNRDKCQSALRKCWSSTLLQSSRVEGTTDSNTVVLCVVSPNFQIYSSIFIVTFKLSIMQVSPKWNNNESQLLIEVFLITDTLLYNCSSLKKTTFFMYVLISCYSLFLKTVYFL